MTAGGEPRRASKPMGEEGRFKRLLAGLNTLSMSSSRPDKHELSYSLHQGCWPELARGFQISSAGLILTKLHSYQHYSVQPREGSGREVRGKCILSKILSYFLRVIKRNQGQIFPIPCLAQTEMEVYSGVWKQIPQLLVNLNLVYNASDLEKGSCLNEEDPCTPFRIKSKV